MPGPRYFRESPDTRSQERRTGRRRKKQIGRLGVFFNSETGEHQRTVRVTAGQFASIVKNQSGKPAKQLLLEYGESRRQPSHTTFLDRRTENRRFYTRRRADRKKKHKNWIRSQLLSDWFWLPFLQKKKGLKNSLFFGFWFFSRLFVVVFQIVFVNFDVFVGFGDHFRGFSKAFSQELFAFGSRANHLAVFE